MSSWSQRWRLWRWRRRQPIEAWLILTPILLYYVVFNMVPVLLNVYVSFTEWNGISGLPKWVGLGNYLRYLRAPYPLIIFNTALFAVAILVLQTSLAFLIAVLLNQKITGRGVYRSIWYIPTLTSAAIMAQVAFIFISPYDGVINAILENLGMDRVIWTLQGEWMRFFIVMFTIWRGVGVAMVLFLAGLQGIHPELYEAAKVDGGKNTQLLRYITIPLLRPLILFIVVTGIINSFQIFEAVFLITKGGPKNMTNVMLYQIYNDAFTNFNLGVASAGAVIMAVLLLGFSIVGMRVMSQGQQEA